MLYTPSVKNVDLLGPDRLIAPSNQRTSRYSALIKTGRSVPKWFHPTIHDVHQGALVAHQRLDDRGSPTVPM